MDTAVYEQGGPLENAITSTGAGTGYDGHAHANGKEHGRVNGEKRSVEHIPDSENKGLSGIAKDYHIRHFRKERVGAEVQA